MADGELGLAVVELRHPQAAQLEQVRGQQFLVPELAVEGGVQVAQLRAQRQGRIERRAAFRPLQPGHVCILASCSRRRNGQ